jgi:hypothetical protein
MVLMTTVMMLMAATMSIPIASSSSIIAAMVIALAVRVVSVVITGVVRAGAGTRGVVDAPYHRQNSNKQSDRQNVSHRISIVEPKLIKEKCTPSRGASTIKFQEIQSRFVSRVFSLVGSSCVNTGEGIALVVRKSL